MTIDILNSLPEKIQVEGEFSTRKIWIDGKPLSPVRSQKVYNHSPDGFNWGYGGSGPAQLALAILLKYLPKEDAQHLYQRFKFRIVGGWPRTDFNTTLYLRETITNLMKGES